MGGQNHQPCREFLANSTRLSRGVSCVSISLETFNIRLEDKILANLDGEYVTLDHLLTCAKEVKSKVQLVHEAFGILSLQMDERYYVDLPAANGFDYQDFGNKVSAAGMVGQVPFRRIAMQYKVGGFRAALAYMRAEAVGFEGKVDTMLALVEFLVSEKVADIAAEFESNGIGNIRPDFAKMYTAWHDFQQTFLASSLISTEIFYVSEGCGSLLVGNQVPTVTSI